MSNPSSSIVLVQWTTDSYTVCEVSLNLPKAVNAKVKTNWGGRPGRPVRKVLRDWSLITGKGPEKQEEGGGHVKFYPYEKGGGGADKVSAMLKGGGGAHKRFWGSFYTVA